MLLHRLGIGSGKLAIQPGNDSIKGLGTTHVGILRCLEDEGVVWTQNPRQAVPCSG